jgi:hypothetical protein
MQRRRPEFASVPDRKRRRQTWAFSFRRESDRSSRPAFHRDALARLREDYRAFLRKAGKANPTDFKDLTGLSRKFIIPLMEYFDQSKLTIRVGDHRVLREKEKDDLP